MSNFACCCSEVILSTLSRSSSSGLLACQCCEIIFFWQGCQSNFGVWTAAPCALQTDAAAKHKKPPARRWSVGPHRSPSQRQAPSTASTFSSPLARPLVLSRETASFFRLDSALIAKGRHGQSARPAPPSIAQARSVGQPPISPASLKQVQPGHRFNLRPPLTPSVAVSRSLIPPGTSSSGSHPVYTFFIAPSGPNRTVALRLTRWLPPRTVSRSRQPPTSVSALSKNKSLVDSMLTSLLPTFDSQPAAARRWNGRV